MMQSVQETNGSILCPRCGAYRDPASSCWFCGDIPLAQRREVVIPTRCYDCGGALIDWSPSPYCSQCGHIVPREERGY